MENLEQIGIYELEEDGGIREKLFLSKNVKAVAFQQRFQAKCGISCIVIWLFVLIPYEGDGEQQHAAFSENPVYFLMKIVRSEDMHYNLIAQDRIESLALDCAFLSSVTLVPPPFRTSRRA